MLDFADASCQRFAASLSMMPPFSFFMLRAIFAMPLFYFHFRDIYFLIISLRCYAVDYFRR